MKRTLVGSCFVVTLVLLGLVVFRDGERILGLGGSPTPTLPNLPRITVDNIGDLQEIETFAVDGSPTDLVFNLESDILVVSDSQDVLFLWDRRSKSLSQLEKYAGPIYSVTFNPSGDLLASAGPNRSATLWTIDPPIEQNSLVIGYNVLDVGFTPDGETLAISGESDLDRSDLRMTPSGGFITFWSFGVEDDIVTRDILEVPGIVETISLNSDGRYVAGGVNQQIPEKPINFVGVWDTADLHLLHSFDVGESRITDVEFRPFDSQLAVATDDGQLFLWDMRDFDQQGSLVGHTGEIVDVCYSPEGDLLASVDSNGKVWIWDSETGKSLFSLFVDPPGEFPLGGLQFSPDGTMLGYVSGDGTMTIWAIIEVF